MFFSSNIPLTNHTMGVLYQHFLAFLKFNYFIVELRSGKFSDQI